MTSREKIFGRIRTALEPIKERASYPAYESSVAEPIWLAAETDMAALFTRRLTLAGGVVLDGPSALLAWLASQGAKRLYVDPLVFPVIGETFDFGISVTSGYSREAVDEIDTALTLASAGIAETGSLILTDRDTPDRLAALAPWRHIALLRREQIFRTIGEAIAGQPGDPGIIWVTGPSKTADVEGILIQGVHGPGVQACLLI